MFVKLFTLDSAVILVVVLICLYIADSQVTVFLSTIDEYFRCTTDFTGLYREHLVLK